jgi:hypothetical protein
MGATNFRRRHGENAEDGRMTYSQQLHDDAKKLRERVERRRRTQRKYDSSERGRTRHRDYNHSEKGRARQQRYRQKFI